MWRIFAVFPEGKQYIGIFDTIETAKEFKYEIESEGELIIEIEKAVEFA